MFDEMMQWTYTTLVTTQDYVMVNWVIIHYHPDNDYVIVKKQKKQESIYMSTLTGLFESTVKFNRYGANV